MPPTKVDLAGLSHLTAVVDASNGRLQEHLAVGLPSLLLVLSLPVTLVRLAVMGMDCVAVRTEVLDTPCQPGPAREGVTLRREVERAGRGGHAQARTGMALCCGVLAACVSTVILMGFVTYLVMMLSS